MRKYVIAGNWKMNKNPQEATQLIEAIKPLVKEAACDVVVGVPFVDLTAALEAFFLRRRFSEPGGAQKGIPASSRSSGM